MVIDIDDNSGFCNGVVGAITKAENELERSGSLYCLGDIVHNGEEVARLSNKGLKTIEHSDLKNLSGATVLLRAHGEPPTTYATAEELNINVIDATCPVVLALQRKIKKAYEEGNKKQQIVIYGKKGHAEVNGLVGQTEGTAIVLESADDLDKLDFSKDIILFSQTTKSIEGFNEIVAQIQVKLKGNVIFKYNDTICRQVANRIPKIINFVSRYDIVLFVCGNKSSNGKVLYEHCLQQNPNTIRISNVDELDIEKLKGAERIGICGATSTPKWQMEAVKDYIITRTRE